MTGTPSTTLTGGHSTPEEAGTGVTSSAAATGRTPGAISSPSIRTAVSTRVIAASYGYGPKGAPRHLNARGARTVPRLELPAEGLGELLAVVEGVLGVDPQQVVEREPATLAVLRIAGEVRLGEVLEHVERASSHRREDRE